jgi:HEPN domain-containing protein
MVLCLLPPRLPAGPARAEQGAKPRATPRTRGGLRHNAGEEAAIGSVVAVGNRREELRWPDQAEAGVRAASHCRAAGDFYAAAFLAQQAAEKALKALPYLHGYRAILSQRVVDLLREASALAPGLAGLEPLGRELDRHYIGAHCPNLYPAGAPHRYYSDQEAERCVSYAASILEAVRSSFAD